MKVWLHGLHSLQEELHGRVLFQHCAVNLLEWGALRKRRQGERERYKLLLGTQVQDLAARDQQLRGRSSKAVTASATRWHLWPSAL
jgi:hypothetical protein